jgi:hypothetical protein
MPKATVRKKAGKPAKDEAAKNALTSDLKQLGNEGNGAGGDAGDALDPLQGFKLGGRPDLEHLVFLDPGRSIDLLTDIPAQNEPALTRFRTYGELIGSKRLKRIAELDMRHSVSTARKGRSEVVHVRSNEQTARLLEARMQARQEVID